MRQNVKFTVTLYCALALAWLFSGERFLDSVFEMVDLGRVDDMVIMAAIVLEEGKASLGLPDVFSALRSVLHWGLGVRG